MADEPEQASASNEPGRGWTAERAFQTAPDHQIFYSDLINISTTGPEIVLSVYQTIPGYPSDDPPRAITTRRATIIISPQHAKNLGRLLMKHASHVLESEE